MREIGIPFQVHAANINEDQFANEPPIAYALRLAREKAQAVAAQFPQSYVLGADTIVVLNGEVLGKPQDHAGVRGTEIVAQAIPAAAHKKITTSCKKESYLRKVAQSTLAETRASTTKVYFREIAEAEIQQYVAGGEPMDKAGAYAIQGGASRWTDHIEGEFSNVVGLPLSLVTEMLKITGLMKS